MKHSKHLTPAQIQAFQRDGYLVIPGFYAPAEMEQIHRWVDEVQGFPDAPGKYQRYYEPSKVDSERRILSRMENLSPYHAGFAELFQGSKLAQAASELLGEPAVLFKDKINFKLPGGDGFKPHQDQQAGWWSYANFFISTLVCVDEATEDNGCLEMAAGHHKRGMFREWEPLTEEDMEGMEFVPCPTQPGDVVFFDSYAPHRSGPNLSDQRRRLLYVTYNRLSEGDHRARYYEDKRKSYPQDCEREQNKEYRFRV